MAGLLKAEVHRLNKTWEHLKSADPVAFATFTRLNELMDAGTGTYPKLLERLQRKSRRLVSMNTHTHTHQLAKCKHMTCCKTLTLDT